MGKNKTKKKIKFWEQYKDSSINKGAKKEIKRLERIYRNHRKHKKD